MEQREFTAWLRSPRESTGIRFAHRDGWDHWPYPRLAGLAGRFAAVYRSEGVREGDVVAILLDTGPEFVAALYAAAAVGAAAAPVAPPPLFGPAAEHTLRIEAVLDNARPTLVVTSTRHRGHTGDRRALIAEEIAEEATSAMTGAGRHTGGRLTGEPVGLLAPAEPDRTVLVQFTSGSTASPRGVRVSEGALATTLSTLGGWLDHTPDTPTASWLPLHHDMGLVGCLLGPVAHQADLWLLPTAEFVRRPLRYLRCFSEHRAALSAMPVFGLDHISARVRPRDLAGADFSSWRVLILGAERIDPDSLRRFHDLLGPHGFDPAAFAPAYGLAEATLAVTGTPAGRGWRSLTVDPATLVPGARVVRADVPAAREIVSCGPPLGRARVRVLDDRGDAVDDGVVGEISVEGPMVASGYVGDSEATGSRLEGSGVRTGDAGFLLDGELFVLGRLGDAMKIRGRTVYAEDLEAVLGHEGARPVVALGSRAARPVVLAVVGTTESGARIERIRSTLDRLGEGASVEVRRVPAARVPRTTSGKPRRRELFRRFLNGELDEAGSTVGELAKP
ncbi:AMP-binding protein [Saccharomonospora cyanea]|uniref:Acyl-CoA synthetase (AMP-forming)/AMP-acid ligase II n=1 Tax=Saccharomonospora cyanea NA-134 TaxID=882082 RepID=H5XHL7_9PSEU|nr:AMP-binding protein [Saccharomonospora cyanea]EHR61697.1 acyl-CoA synthetase (AMP-forming)/AMP-acid ligase II [Saccharomonospora cyanea NA-134]